MSFINNIKVYDTPYIKIRYGVDSDGGYVALKEISEKCQSLYSYGVSYDISFEIDFFKKNKECAVKLFDHTIVEIPEMPKEFMFLSEGIGTEKTECLDSLKNHLERFGDLGTKNKILKIDIEWNEWEVFEKMDDETMDSFDQILCEFHLTPVSYNDNHSPYFTEFHQFVYNKINDLLFDKYSKVFDRLQNFYYIYHVHGNNSLPAIEFKGEFIPQLLEVSMVNKKYVDDPIISNSIFPVEGLDYPNKPWKDEIKNILWNK
jgi:hypothetical protein